MKTLIAVARRMLFLMVFMLPLSAVLTFMLQTFLPAFIGSVAAVTIAYLAASWLVDKYLLP